MVNGVWETNPLVIKEIFYVFSPSNLKTPWSTGLVSYVQILIQSRIRKRHLWKLHSLSWRSRMLFENVPGIGPRDLMVLTSNLLRDVGMGYKMISSGFSIAFTRRLL
ncbi:hypothetical protein HanRHA438_Chr01g0019211 [Helianthus annuus]|nr:hypothetical protein HanRHA438_Chr01g0019211 [Helianthus annuus]